MRRRWLAALALLLPSSALADTLVDNVNGISIDRNGGVTRFAAMVIDDDGRISQILSSRERARQVDFREDGRGRTVMPGFVDAHVQLMQLGLEQLTLDLSSARTLQEAQAQIAAYAAEHPERQWIVGRGWNEDAWGLGRSPTAADLDAAVGDRPAWLVRADGHVGWANSLALAAGAVTANTADPANGRIERLPGSRQPSGILVEAAMALIAGQVPPPQPEDMDLALHEAQDVLVRQGVTAVADMGTSIEDWMAFRRAGDEGRLRVRIMAYSRTLPEMLLIGGPGPTAWLYDDRLRLNGLQLVLDGTIGSRTAWLKTPYADRPGMRGLTQLNGTQLRNLMSRAAMDGFQVAIRASGDAATDEALLAIEELAADYGGDRRWRIEHAQVVDPADLARLGRNGIIASLQPTDRLEDGLVAELRLGAQRLAGAHLLQSIHATGAPLALGSGAPAAPPRPFEALAAAIEGAERITREHAFAAATAAAAFAGQAEGRFGRLAAGQRADFVVLDGDPLLADAQALRRIRVLETWIGGRKVYEASPSRARAADAPGR
jgi:predicted amidohydrolase YtcJ